MSHESIGSLKKTCCKEKHLMRRAQEQMSQQRLPLSQQGPC
jgi:hypothetical protein